MFGPHITWFVVLAFLDALAFLLCLAIFGYPLIRKAWNPKDVEAPLRETFQILPDARLPFTVGICFCLAFVPCFVGGTFLQMGFFRAFSFVVEWVGCLALVIGVVLAFVRRGPGTRVIRIWGSLLLIFLLIPLVILAFAPGGWFAS
jgi:hypothetical protein